MITHMKLTKLNFTPREEESPIRVTSRRTIERDTRREVRRVVRIVQTRKTEIRV